MKNHEANSCQDTSSLSTWKFRAKVNKFAGGRWAGWHPCGGLPFLWATHDWHHHEAFHWSEGIWRSWRNWVVGDMIFLHDQSWRMSFAGKDCSCTNSRDHHVVWISWTNLQPSDSWTQLKNSGHQVSLPFTKKCWKNPRANKHLLNPGIHAAARGFCFAAGGAGVKAVAQVCTFRIIHGR